MTRSGAAAGYRPPPTATSVVQDVRSGRSTARRETERALARITERDPGIGAFQVVRAEAACREADAVDARPDRAELPLAGLPIAIKDNISVTGEPMRLGTAATDPAPQRGDHEVVRRLRAAGAVVVGLTRMPELGVFGTTDSVFGVTRNPWDPRRTPGGSSGGSAAAVAAGMVAAAHGNDGMGSLRIPAACCGLVALKPGFGVVPAGLGDNAWFGMAENGALATSAQDLALLCSVMAGRPGLVMPSDPGTVRVALSTRPPAAGLPVESSWKAAARAVGAMLREAGHTVRQADPGYPPQLAGWGIVRWVAGTASDARRVADRTKLEPRTRRHAALGAAALRAGLPRPAGAQRWQAAVQRFFADSDVLLTPALAQSPPRALEWHRRGWAVNVTSDARYAPFAAPWNLAGCPAAVVPAGVGPDGLPRAVQLVAPPGGEALLLGLAAQLERVRPWQRTAYLD